MAKVCQVTGRRPQFGKTVSHSHKRTSRRWNPNVQKKTYYSPMLGRKVRLRVTPKGMKTIDKYGIDAVVSDMLARGEKI
ncbi:large subunit ribosomal protein L28 [Actinobaculum suis]|uniref:Large ribosomal subunit protein bL28 n=1 Tax=Actinobaculum suis TaxID=1657 RepID=A0A1G7ECI7_9ACTO|nr:50S ribosomal protein L28 [Actinobaculum suis]MDY5153054.1 50S ribosomal protein L28 [Actinobaculum suis]SDE61297.1 large subunit ribosomal protein L28 [Actinobaculum suis]VDG76522.1 50S ribosomal protein L28 [Actinobaculum suis]